MHYRLVPSQSLMLLILQTPRLLLAYTYGLKVEVFGTWLLAFCKPKMGNVKMQLIGQFMYGDPLTRCEGGTYAHY